MPSWRLSPKPSSDNSKGAKLHLGLCQRGRADWWYCRRPDVGFMLTC